MLEAGGAENLEKEGVVVSNIKALRLFLFKLRQGFTSKNGTLFL